MQCTAVIAMQQRHVAFFQLHCKFAKALLGDYQPQTQMFHECCEITLKTHPVLSNAQALTCLSMLQGRYNLRREEVHVEEGNHDLNKCCILQHHSGIFVQGILPCLRLKRGTQAGLCQQQAVLLHQCKSLAHGSTCLDNVVICYVQLQRTAHYQSKHMSFTIVGAQHVAHGSTCLDNVIVCYLQVQRTAHCQSQHCWKAMRTKVLRI